MATSIHFRFSIYSYTILIWGLLFLISTSVHGQKPEIMEDDAPSSTSTEKVYRITEEMPRFPGCEHLKMQGNKIRCAEKSLLEYIYQNIRYPKKARIKGIEGIVIVQFVIDTSGYLTDIKIDRDVGGGTGEEVVRIIEKMNKEGLRWIPGKQDGKAVKVQFVMPVNFELD